MTPDDFREIALSLPEAKEAGHMGHPDFRVRGKVFATLGYPTKEHAVVILDPAQQAKLIVTRPKTFSAVKGFWGKRGSTQILLETATPAAVRSAIAAAWRRVAPASLTNGAKRAT